MSPTRSERSSEQRPSVKCIVMNSFTNDFRVLKTSRSLAAAGYEVEVVALHDNRADLPERDVVHGVQVCRIRLGSKGWWRVRALQYLKYIEFLIRASVHCRGADIYHCNDLSALPVGIICRAFSRGRARIVYDSHEHQSERAGFSRTMRWLTRFLEARLVRRADAVITVSASIADEYARLYRIPPPHLIYNAPYYLEKEKTDTLRQLFKLAADRKIFLFQGGMMKSRGIETLLQSFADMDKHFCLVLIGGGALEPMVKAYASKHDNIFHVPTVDPMALWQLTFSADYGVHLIENTCLNHYLCLPNKLFEYLMAELPVLVSNMREMESFVREHQVGCVTSVSVAEVRERIVELALQDRDGYVRNIKRIKSEFSWERQERKLLEIYSKLGVISH